MSTDVIENRAGHLSPPEKSQLFIQIGVVLALVGIMYYPTLVWMLDRWTQADSYYSHGFLIPLVVGFLIWKNRERLRQLFHHEDNVKFRMSFANVSLVLGGVVAHLLGAYLQVYFLPGFSMIPLFLGLAGYFFGDKIFKEVAFPLLFLVFMIPIPLVVIAGLSFQLKLLASKGALIMLSQMQVPAIMQGSFVRTPHAVLLIGDVCSGLRSLISLLTLGAIFAYLFRGSCIRKAILFLSAVPIAITVNGVRIFLLCLVAEIYGTKFATGFFHDFSGLLLFVMAFVGLEIVSKTLETGKTA